MMDEQNKIPNDSVIIPEYIQCVECMVCMCVVPAYKYCGICGYPTGRPVKYRNE